MSFNYAILVRCGCRAPDSKQLGQSCPKLWRKDGIWNGKHGTAGFAVRIPTSGGVRLVKRFGYESKTDAKTAADAVGKLLDLAGADDATRKRIGDLIIAVKRGTSLPAVEDVRRRLGLGLDLASTGDTFGQAWTSWLAGKKRLRQSARERLEQIGKHWLLPVLQDVPLERLNAAHVSEVFARIEHINAEISVRQGSSRAYVTVDGDLRARPRVVRVAS